MNLESLLAPLLPYYLQGEYDLCQTHITSIEMDSRRVHSGSLFICIEGYQVDGHQFANQAKQQGAVAIISQIPLDIELPIIVVPDTKRALAVLASHFYGYPTSKLRLIGITGTNGKTTTTYLIEKLLEDHGKKTGRIGTIDMKIGQEVMAVPNTTPESLELQKAFSKMINAGADYAVIEASSHAIHMGRTRGCNFGTVVFTNLTQDHLDYHGSMDEYRRAKGLIFAHLGNRYDDKDLKFAILNSDDESHPYFQQITPAQVVTYGIDKEANIRAKNVRMTQSGTSFTVDSFQGIEDFHIQMLGKFNVYNMLAAIGVGLVEGLTLTQIKSSLEEISGVRGRLEMLDEEQDFTVIVDYAHTPDSLENVLTTIQEFAKGKIYCVVGCGGDRDRKKRPIMARIATNYADFSIFTADNPRSEEPKNIINDMIVGLIQDKIPQTKYKSIVDRKEAIQWVIGQAKKNDVILIAGKGHETYQVIKDQTISFDDREVAKEAIQKRLSR